MNIKNLKVGDEVEWILSQGNQSDTISEVGVDESRETPYIKLANISTTFYQHDADRVKMTVKKTTKEDRCELCGKLGGMGKTQGTSGGHILCYDCAKLAEAEKMISVDSDGIWYDYADNRLESYIRLKTEDGYGNKIGKLYSKLGVVTIDSMHSGDTVQIKNKDGCVIATYEVQ